MTFARFILVALAASCLSGCMTAAETRLADEARCYGYGFRAGTVPFAQCLQKIDLDRSADRRQLLSGPGFGYGPRLGWRGGWY